MSREMLGATGFESTNLEEQLTANKAATDSLKGTILNVTETTERTAPVQEAETEDDEFQSLFKTVKNYKEGDVISGVVSKIVNGVVYVDIAFKSEGIIEPDELTNRPNTKANDICKVGDVINVKIMRLENKAGNPVLSKKRADYETAWGTINHAAKTGEDIQVYVSSKKEGGLNVNYEGIQAFIPNNHLSKEDLDHADALVGKTIHCKVLKVIRARKKVILSHKSSQEKSRQQLLEAMKQIKVGEVLEGTVRSIKSFGAFINLGDFDGLVHISELSWSHVEKVEDALELDQKVKVYVLGIDENTARISLSIKKLQSDPWENIDQRYKPGDKVNCTITRFAQFGAFATIEDGIEGLIHLTELSDEKQVKYPEEAVKIGETYPGTVLRIDNKTRKIGLTLRTAVPAPEQPTA
jgi:ribosomal protein S1